RKNIILFCFFYILSTQIFSEEFLLMPKTDSIDQNIDNQVFKNPQIKNISQTDSSKIQTTVKDDLDDWLTPIIAFIPTESITLIGVEFYKLRWKMFQLGSPSILISTDGIFSISVFNCGIKYSFGAQKSHQVGLSFDMFFIKIDEKDIVKRYDFPIELSYRYSFADGVFFESGAGIFINYNIEDSIKNIELSSKFNKVMLFFRFSFAYQLIKNHKNIIF
ncbi:hypothetical protein JXR93_14190, partial [bacterium]|nr:hypothetical protein [bacterium]